MRYIGSFFSRITSDFRQKELLPLKLLFFVHSSTLYVLYPYLTIHMRELGINVEETAIMSAVTPVVAIIMPPIAGVIADRIGNFKILLSLFSGLGGAASLLLLLVPVGRSVVTYPERAVLDLHCHQGELVMNIVDAYPCSKISNLTSQFDMKLEACGLICSSPQSLVHPYVDMAPLTYGDEAQAIRDTKSYQIDLRDPTLNLTDKYLYNLNATTIVKSGKRLKAPQFSTSVNQLTNSTFFFPTAGLYDLTCKSDNTSGSYLCQVVLNGPNEPERVVTPRTSVYKVLVHSRNVPDSNLINSFRVDLMKPMSSNQFKNSTCLEHEAKVHTVSVPLVEPQGGITSLELKDCISRCLTTAPRKSICSSTSHVVEHDVSLTFWMYLVIRVFIGMIGGTAFAMFEGAVIAILREHKADYGLQRIYATIGGMISSPLSGWLIDYASEKHGFTDFRPAFYLYATMKIISAFLMLSINLEFKAPAKNVIDDVMVVLKQTEIVALLFTCFILGTAWGYIESFLFWLLQDLGASRSLMGITITVGGVAGLPLLVMSGPIIDKIGHANVLFIGFIFYAIRLLGYSIIYNPWHCLIFEAMESVTSSLAFTAAVTYAAKLSSTSTDSSIQGLIGGLYFGVGKGAGSLLGGYLMKSIGTRPTYQIFAAITLFTGCIYFLFNKFYIQRRATKEKSDNEKKVDKEEQGVITDKPKMNSNHLSNKETNESIPMNSVKNKLNSYNTHEKTNNESPIIKTSDDGLSRVNEGFEPDEPSQTR